MCIYMYSIVVYMYTYLCICIHAPPRRLWRPNVSAHESVKCLWRKFRTTASVRSRA